MSPKLIVSTVMGAWWLGMAIANDLAGRIAKFTGIEGEVGQTQVIPPPRETVHIYGQVFGKLAFASFIAAALCFLISPLLKKWSHTEAPPE
jgi:POT family proton-dependent oligopeptide transporter